MRQSTPPLSSLQHLGAASLAFCASLIPIVKHTATTLTVSPQPAAQLAHPPGGAWTYASLYCPKAKQDHVLVQHVRPFVDAFEKEGAITEWFFVRYGGVRPHLRLRFKGSPGVLLERVVSFWRHGKSSTASHSTHTNPRLSATVESTA